MALRKTALLAVGAVVLVIGVLLTASFLRGKAAADRWGRRDGNLQFRGVVLGPCPDLGLPNGGTAGYRCRGENLVWGFDYNGGGSSSCPPAPGCTAPRNVRTRIYVRCGTDEVLYSAWEGY